MSRYLRREEAKASTIYRDIKAKALEYLKISGSFRKSTVVADLNLGVFADSIRWDYIRDMIQEGGEAVGESMELIPMAEAYFKFRVEINDKMERNTPELQQRLPERFIAMGHGKKTAGYALVEPKNGHFVVVIARTKNAVARGTQVAADKFDAKATLAGVKPKLVRAS